MKYHSLGKIRFWKYSHQNNSQQNFLSLVVSEESFYGEILLLTIFSSSCVLFHLFQLDKKPLLKWKSVKETSLGFWPWITCTSWFAKAIMHDNMKRDNGSLGLEYILEIFQQLQACLLTNSVKIFHWSNYYLLKIFHVINFYWWIPLMKIFYQQTFSEHSIC